MSNDSNQPPEGQYNVNGNNFSAHDGELLRRSQEQQGVPGGPPGSAPVSGSAGQVPARPDPLMGGPMQGNMQPYQPMGGPMQGNMPPNQPMGGPMQGNMPPNQPMGGPMQGNMQPYQPMGGPMQGNMPPNQPMGGPMQGNMPPNQPMGGPMQGNMPPNQPMGGPMQGNMPPNQPMGGPMQGNMPPNQPMGGPMQGNMPPNQPMGGPMQGNMPPYQPMGGPMQGNMPPNQSSGEPVPGNGAPPPSSARQIQPIPARPGTSAPRTSMPSQPLGFSGQGLIGRMRQFSGKLAALAGYSPPPPEPPAPYMEIYRVPQPDAIVAPAAQVQPWKRSRTLRVAHKIRQRRQRSRNGYQRIWIAVLLTILLLFLFVTFTASGYGYNYYQQQVPVVASLAQLKMPQDTRIYDRNGVLLYEAYDHNSNDLNAGRRIAVSYNQIPVVMQNAMIAAEDNTFWTNDGVNPTAILRAASSGNGGGSTITQQVIKNLTHNSSYTLTRKVTEAAMALALTQQYPKWKILEMYFNAAPFGTFDNGVETAAESLFNLKRTCNTKTYECTAGISQIAKDSSGKSDPLLGLARASLLASIPNNPSLYDPRVDSINFQRALTRQDYVLNQMMGQGMTVDGTKTGAPITSAVIKQVEALTAKMKFSSYNSVKQAPYFVDWVMYQVAHALDPEDLANGYALFQSSGLNIYTTIDVNLEKYVETSIHDNLDTQEYQLFPAADAGYKIISQALDVNDAAAVVEDAKTGEILAMDGGSDYNNADLKVGGEYNTAAPPDDGNGYDPTTATYDPTDLSKAPTIGRQPGSTMKPIEYAAAFEDGWYPNMEIPDGVTFFPNGSAAGTTIPTGTAQERDINTDGSYYYPNLSTAASDVGLYAPTDYGQTFHNTTTGKTATITYATANSFNVPALKAMAYVGPQNVLTMARRMGIDTLHSTDNGISGIAWALGTMNVPLIQMAGAYQTFADNGKHIVPEGILDIYDNYGHDLFHFDPNHPQGAQVISPQVAFMITSILRDEPDRYDEFGSDPDLSFTDFDSSCLYTVTCNYQMAAKTGTSDGFVDNMTVGYTPDVVVAVWAGNADGEQMANNTVGITGAAPIFSDIIENVSGFCPTRHVSNDCPKYNFEFSSNPTRQFTAPDGLVQSDVSGTNGLAGSGSGYAAYMLPNQVPTQTGLSNGTN